MNLKGFSQMKEASATIYQVHPPPSSRQDKVHGGRDSSAPVHSLGSSSCLTTNSKKYSFSLNQLKVKAFASHSRTRTKQILHQ